MKKELKNKWVAALRSGDYAQGEGLLCKATPEGAKYCCLGVLVEEAYGEDAWELSMNTKLSFKGHSGFLPETCRDELGLSWDEANEAAWMNDKKGKSFEEIADWIEQNL